MRPAMRPRRSSLLPEFPKRRNGRGRKAGTVAVYVRKRFHTSAIRTVANINPTAQFLRAVHDRLVPDFGLLLNTFPIAEQEDVREL